MSSEIKPAIKALFSCVDIPTDRIRARKTANSFSIIQAISDHGVDVLTEQYDSIVQDIDELTAKLYPSRHCNDPEPEQLQELEKLNTDRKIVFSVLELLDCIKSQAATKVSQCKTMEARI
ncbi:hypothetical protein [Paraglaciecola sp. 25GB23A]|uniref:hypothetical protein n=1 Tax=Paraglaciecola sp. 25GB23A TaxID=3156068 RepID=UPI0032AF7A16